MGEDVFYYETHIVTSGACPRLRDMGFWSSELTMDQSGEERAGEVIWTTRDKSRTTAERRLKEVLEELSVYRETSYDELRSLNKQPIYLVRRYKIEACVLDSKRDDSFWRIVTGTKAE